MSVKRNEAETRRDRIDPKLREAGWNIDDPDQVLFEVDTINSDFKAGIYKTQSHYNHTSVYVRCVKIFFKYM